MKIVSNKNDQVTPFKQIPVGAVFIDQLDGLIYMKAQYDGKETAVIISKDKCVNPEEYFVGDTHDESLFYDDSELTIIHDCALSTNFFD